MAYKIESETEVNVSLSEEANNYGSSDESEADPKNVINSLRRKEVALRARLPCS